jgi:hypothetical protein
MVEYVNILSDLIIYLVFVLIQLRNMSTWKKATIIIAIFNLLMIGVDLIMISFYGTQIRSTLAWLLGNEDRTILSNLLFIEGAFTVGIGALLAAGYAESRMHRANLPSTPYVVEKLSKQRSKFRKKQISTGLLLMLAGIPLVIMSILSAVS